MTDLSTFPLDERLALSDGWITPCDGSVHLSEEPYDCGLPWMHGTHHGYEVPDYSHDLNALKSGPEKRLREAGWKVIDIHEVADVDYWYVRLGNAREFVEALAHTEARARAEADCLAFEAMK